MPFHFASCLLRRLLLVLMCLMSIGGAASADTPDHAAANFASEGGNIIYLAAGVGLPLLSDGRYGTTHALRAADALASSVLVSEGLKYLVREKRPDSSSHDSFPSGHATAAFAVATAESDWHPREAPLWYLGATLIAASRVRLHRHYAQDVLAGAALGYGMTRLELSAPRGLLVAPFVKSEHDSAGGIQLSLTF